ncbi:MAG TPA: cell division protein FtsZ [Synergistaceae bacterium]|nr:cell division protein FtsZ [Synergistaceae bacterium]HPJ24791.1 cell division protein FtsZ [Synergistaceae bacterium]HPQ36230.1 cell division protein FtsZ [Synergistaceae bacterium]
MPEMFQIEEPTRQFREVIKVVGIGGGGNNALNHIVQSGVAGVEFIAANTDIAHLERSETKNRIVLGAQMTKGLGAGANPEIGFQAAKESADEIKASLGGADMVFITAGMGGGTGTGASPVIAEVAKELGALVVAVVTRPFKFEGKRRITQANEGIERLRDKVDALIVVPNDKLLQLADKTTPLSDTFALADDVLRQAVQGVTDLILRPGLVNVDFADVKTVMSNAGSAIMGIGEGSGEDRAHTAARASINSPLMESSMTGAKGVLFNVTGGPNVGIHEIHQVAQVITEAADEDASIIWGHVLDPSMEESIMITVIATGFTHLLSGSKTVSGQVADRTHGGKRLELEEGEVRSITDGEDLFVINGLPMEEIDKPAILRRKQKN